MKRIALTEQTAALGQKNNVNSDIEGGEKHDAGGRKTKNTLAGRRSLLKQGRKKGDSKRLGHSGGEGKKPQRGIGACAASATIERENPRAGPGKNAHRCVPREKNRKRGHAARGSQWRAKGKKKDAAFQRHSGQYQSRQRDEKARQTISKGKYGSAMDKQKSGHLSPPKKKRLCRSEGGRRPSMAEQRSGKPAQQKGVRKRKR